MSPRPPPPPGVYLQIYRTALEGDRARALAAVCRTAASLGCPGIVLHGFPRELWASWDYESSVVAAHGLLALASWGEDLTVDNNGTRLTADKKGGLAGEVLVRATCTAGLIDAEGAWDTMTGLDDDTSESGALVLGASLRAFAPDAWVGDQPWFAIASHGHARAVPRPLGQGGPFAGFPSDEFASFLNWGRFRQAYCNDFKRQFGDERYAKIFAWMDRDWTDHDALLATDGLSRPLRVTLQGFGWVPQHLAHAVLTYAVCLQQPVILWCEPAPSEDTIAVLTGVRILQEQGFAGPGTDARAAVRMFQQSANTYGEGLVEDGWMGRQTLAALGIVLP